MIQRYRCLIEEWCLEDDCLVGKDWRANENMNNEEESCSCILHEVSVYTNGFWRGSCRTYMHHGSR
jgi:hypothetical protein